MNSRDAKDAVAEGRRELGEFPAEVDNSRQLGDIAIALRKKVLPHLDRAKNALEATPRDEKNAEAWLGYLSFEAFVFEYLAENADKVEAASETFWARVRDACQGILDIHQAHDVLTDESLEHFGRKLNRARSRADGAEPSSFSGNDRGCFVATACYRDEFHRDVETFRSFRDNSLMHTRSGRALVTVYYLVSPNVARLLDHGPMTAELLRRWLLAPLARLLRQS